MIISYHDDQMIYGFIWFRYRIYTKNWEDAVETIVFGHPTATQYGYYSAENAKFMGITLARANL